jgi:hypothetical protein
MEPRAAKSTDLFAARRKELAMSDVPDSGDNVNAADEAMEMEIWLEPIEEELRGQILADLDSGSVFSFLCRAPNVNRLELVWMNRKALRDRGLYEEALLLAFTTAKANNRRWPMRALASMFAFADRDKLRAVGDPLPKSPYTLYRGVAGLGPSRRVRGYSWTGSLERAEWFASRFSPPLHDPAVYAVTVREADILAYVGDSEQEFIVSLPREVKPVRIKSLGLARRAPADHCSSKPDAGSAIPCKQRAGIPPDPALGIVEEGI